MQYRSASGSSTPLVVIAKFRWKYPGQSIVCDHGERRAGIGVEHLYARRSQRQQLDINAMAIHVLESLCLEIEQLWQEARLGSCRCVVDRCQQREIEIGSAGTGYVTKGTGDFGKSARFFRSDLAKLAFRSMGVTLCGMCLAEPSTCDLDPQHGQIGKNSSATHDVPLFPKGTI